MDLDKFNQNNDSELAIKLKEFYGKYFIDGFDANIIDDILSLEDNTARL